MSVLSGRRFLSVWLRRLSTDRIERRLSAPADGPRVVVASIKSAQRIVAINDAAAALGLNAGMALADARARYPALPVAEADPHADRRLLEAVADWCDRYTPLVGLDPPDGLLLDITGCAHLFGGETALARDLVARLACQGFSVRAAVADTVGGAWAVAHYGEFSLVIPGRTPLAREPGIQNRIPSSALDSGSRAGARVRNDGETFIVPRGKTESALLPLPVASLRIDPAVAADLKTMGLERVADLAPRPRSPLAARFGEGLILRLDQALGRADESIMPRLPVPAAVAEQRFAEPIAREDDVLGTVEQLACRLAGVLERRGEGARLIQLALFRADGAVHRLELGTGAPLRAPARVRKLFEERLAALGDACDPGFGFDVVRLSALVTERNDPAQIGLGGGDGAEELAHLVDRLGARFGLRRVSRIVPQDTHIPEFAAASVPAHAARGSASGTQAEMAEQDSLLPIRPLRLLARPEPIDAVAEVPDGPPIRFRWRQVLHQVAAAEGPERIAMEWWRDDRGQALTRDYFRVENALGARMWLYREGLFGEIGRPRWFLHGLFA